MALAEPSSFTGRQPLRVLCVIANPVNLGRFDETAAWQDIVEALQPQIARGSIVLERLLEPTETALKRSLAQAQWHVVHLVVHGQERAAANYGTITLNSSEGRARNLTGAYAAGLFAGSASTRLVILQAAGEAGSGFQTTATALADAGLAVLTVPRLSGRAARIFVSRCHAGLLSGLPPKALAEDLSAALADEGLAAGSVRMVCQDSSWPIFALGQENAAAAAAVSAQPPLDAPANDPSPLLPPAAPHSWQQDLLRKRASGEFDVFLCHNQADTPAVKRIAEQLKTHGVLAWLDVWELRPGQPWQPLVERQIGDIKAAAVFIGAAGIGPWQEQEIGAFLLRFVQKRIPVIPVLLPDAPSKPVLPIFLEAMGWVDLRCPDPDPMHLLVWGITGRRPHD